MVAPSIIAPIQTHLNENCLRKPEILNEPQEELVTPPMPSAPSHEEQDEEGDDYIEDEGEIVTEKDGQQEMKTFHGVSKSKHIPNTTHYKILRYKDPTTKRVRRIMECCYESCG
eukprot:CAMPEP_0170558460 /NCGR_PEP_ID=MMETSP0211-20121228/35550_1 /TAXON_ID=311385 /ORGANISM="Pseudokeronopsis sp., Strain OXSARD2" /LENGTH=113 /DNA_ID=CAMNT_0010870411 /DNA_START=282 /DNA_END=619 /DNA_ORIENTATION=+